MLALFLMRNSTNGRRMLDAHCDQANYLSVQIGKVPVTISGFGP